MSYEIEKIKPTEIPSEIREKLSFWANPNLLSSFITANDLSLFYLVVTHNKTIISIMPIIEKKRYGLTYINQSQEQYYTPITFFLPSDFQLFDMQQTKIEILKQYAKNLKKNYYKTILRFEDKLSDIRAFKWAGFDVTPSYSFQKRMIEYDDNDLPLQLKKKIKQAKKNGLYAKEDWKLETTVSLSQDLSIRKNRAFKQSEKRYLALLDELYSKNFCKMIIVYKDEVPLTFQVLIEDKQDGILYALVTATSKLGLELKSSIFCYDHILSNYPDFQIFDFCGANIEEVAYFKSKFNCELVTYFQVKHCLFI